MKGHPADRLDDMLDHLLQVVSVRGIHGFMHVRDAVQLQSITTQCLSVILRSVHVNSD